MSPSLGWFLLRGAALAFTWYCLVNLGATLAAAAIARPLATGAAPRPPALWFGLRMFGTAAAMLFVAAVFVPSYWVHEPRDTNEAFDLLLTAGAAATLIAIATAMARGVSAWRAATRRTHAWMETAQPIALPGTDIPAYAIDVEAPVLALVGVVRPRLLVTRGLLAALAPDELAAAIAHEIVHARSRDNLKRLAMRSAPDILPRVAAVRALEERWVAAAEHRADHDASHDDPSVRCALASALVKVARLMPPAPPLAEPISTLVGGGDVPSRVRRLLEDRAAPSIARLPRAAAWIGASVLVALFLAGYAPLLRSVHEITEVLVHSLP